MTAFYDEGYNVKDIETCSSMKDQDWPDEVKKGVPRRLLNHFGKNCTCFSLLCTRLSQLYIAPPPHQTSNEGKVTHLLNTIVFARVICNCDYRCLQPTATTDYANKVQFTITRYRNYNRCNYDVIIT